MHQILSDASLHFVFFVYVCRRQRELKPSHSPYRALLDTLELSDSRLTLQLINDNNKVRHTSVSTLFLWVKGFSKMTMNKMTSVTSRSKATPLCQRCERSETHAASCFLQVRLLLELYRLQGNMTRVKINELKPLKPRYEVPDVLIADPLTEPWVVVTILPHTSVPVAQWVVSFFILRVCLQVVSGGSGWERSGLVSGWDWATAHCKRSTVPIGHHWGSSSARVRQLPGAAGFRTPPSTKGHVSPDPHAVDFWSWF